MPRKKGTAKYTANVSVAVEPVQKSDLIAEAERRGVDYSTVCRWAFGEWLDRNAHNKSDAKAS